ncbi:MAG: TonB-dependent receptor [Duncaniella sp.]|nr:TonB-dependent receptor [Duncaniella sp.]
MKISSIHSALLLSLALPLSAAAATAGSDAAIPDTTSYSLNPVVVTGTGMHQRLKSTPVPVEVITGAELRAASLNDLQEALTMMIPSLSFSPSAMGSYLRMNGLTNRHVLVLVNGKKLVGDISGNVDLGQIDTNLIERVEVLNGAASTLYGSDAVGGVINIIMKAPQEKAQASSNSTLRRDNQFDQSLSFNLPAGKVNSLTGFHYSHSDGWQNSDLTQDGDKLEPTIAQLSLGYTSQNLTQRFTYDPTDRLSLYADGGYYHRILDRPAERADIAGGSKYNTMSESWSWGAGGKYILGPVGSISIDYTGRKFGQWYKYMLASGNYNPGDYAKTKGQAFHDLEAKSVLNFSRSSNTIFGLSYRYEQLVRPEEDFDRYMNSFSAYAQHEQRFLNHFTVLAGARFDSYQHIGSRFTPKASLMYKTGNFNVRASYAMGYRAPGLDELYYHLMKPMGSRHIITFGNPDLKSEMSNYFGINLEYRSDRFSASVTGYINRVSNMITSSSTKFSALSPEEQADLIAEFPEINDVKQSTLSVKQYYNYSRANVKGFEINLSAMPVKGLSLSANYTFAYGRGLEDDGSWSNLNRSVRHTATLTANYQHQWSWYRLNLNLNGRIQSKTYYPGDDDGDAPGYGIWNLITRHTFSCFRSFTLTPGIGIDNIFNRRDMRPLNSNFALYSPGRSYVVSLAINL